MHFLLVYSSDYCIFASVMSTKINHVGIVDSISDGCVKVRILQTSACAACKVASHCNASESKEKIVDVMDVKDVSGLKIGDSVVVSASSGVVGHALLLAFGVPFLILMSVLVIALQVLPDEGLAALTAIGALAPYYALLWLMRDSIRQKLSFELE